MEGLKEGPVCAVDAAHEGALLLWHGWGFYFENLQCNLFACLAELLFARGPHAVEGDLPSRGRDLLPEICKITYGCDMS